MVPCLVLKSVWWSGGGGSPRLYGVDYQEIYVG